VSDAERRLLQDLHLEHLGVEIDRISADCTVELPQGDARRDLGRPWSWGSRSPMAPKRSWVAAGVPGLKAPLSWVFVFHRSEKSTPGGVV